MLQSITVVFLAAAAAYSYLHAEYGTAVICATCAGFVGGMVIARAMIMRSLEHL